MVRVSSPAKLRPWSELTAKMVMGVVPGLVILCLHFQGNTPGLLQHVLTVLVFWSLGSAPAPASTLVSEPRIVPLG